MDLFQPTHLLVLAIVGAFLFFGWKQMPEMARSLGRSLRVFKTEIKGLTEDDKAREAHSQQDAEPKAIESRSVQTPVTPVARAEVKRVVTTQTVPASRPRPAPRPTAQTPSAGGQ